MFGNKQSRSLNANYFITLSQQISFKEGKTLILYIIVIIISLHFCQIRMQIQRSGNINDPRCSRVQIVAEIKVFQFYTSKIIFVNRSCSKITLLIILIIIMIISPVTCSPIDIND